MSYKTLFQSLRTLRKQMGIKTSAILEKTGWSRQRLSQLERGELDAQLSTLLTLANAVEVEVMLVPKALAPLIQTVIASGGSLAPQPTKTGIEFLLEKPRP